MTAGPTAIRRTISTGNINEKTGRPAWLRFNGADLPVFFYETSILGKVVKSVRHQIQLSVLLIMTIWSQKYIETNNLTPFDSFDRI